MCHIPHKSICPRDNHILFHWEEKTPIPWIGPYKDFGVALYQLVTTLQKILLDGGCMCKNQPIFIEGFIMDSVIKFGGQQRKIPTN